MLLMLLEFSNNYLYLHLCVFILHHLSSFVISSLPDYYLLTVFYPPPIYFFVLSISLLSTSLCLRSVLVYGCAPLASALLLQSLGPQPTRVELFFLTWH